MKKVGLDLRRQGMSKKSGTKNEGRMVGSRNVRKESMKHKRKKETNELQERKEK